MAYSLNATKSRMWVARWWGISMVLLAGCTPLGLWMYEDPVVTVDHISYEQRRSMLAQSPVVVALAMKNANDYSISAEHVELSLHLDGVPVGQVRQDSTVALAIDTVSTVAVPLVFNSQTASRSRQVTRSGMHSFAVKGQATFQTPIGPRTVRFAQEGSMVFGARASRSSM